MDSFCASGATIVDSLSTLWLADMPERFQRARNWVEQKDFTQLQNCNLFEANIRILGGLLSAGALSGAYRRCPRLLCSLPAQAMPCSMQRRRRLHV